MVRIPAAPGAALDLNEVTQFRFSDVIKIAFEEGGASGFIAGRSIWREALPLSGVERQHFLDTVARPRLDALVAVTNHRARPWTEATR